MAKSALAPRNPVLASYSEKMFANYVKGNANNDYLAPEIENEIAHRKAISLNMNAMVNQLKADGITTPLGHMTHDEALIVFKLLKPTAPKLGITEDKVPDAFKALRTTLYSYLTACGTSAYGDKVTEYLTK
jgi:hypothetical protein